MGWTEFKEKEYEVITGMLCSWLPECGKYILQTEI
jgi:hypothetical protein